MQINSSVHSIIVERTRTNSKRGKRADNFHLSLVIECGGMRGVASGGFLQVLSESMLFDSFDTVHGSSSGACAAAYFLTQQLEEGRKILHEDICTRRIVNPWRFISQPCMVDTDYIVDEVFSKKRKLDAERIISAPGVLNIVTTSVKDGLPVVHKNFENREQILHALKASLRVPGPFEPGIEISGNRHIDGGIAAPLPIFSAVKSGATHILVICTQRVQDYGAAKSWAFLESLALGICYGTPLRRSYFAAQCVNRRFWELAGPSSVQMEVLVRPRNGTHCGWFTIDKEVLKKVEQEAVDVAKSYVETIQSYGRK